MQQIPPLGAGAVGAPHHAHREPVPMLRAALNAVARIRPPGHGTRLAIGFFLQAEAVALVFHGQSLHGCLLSLLGSLIVVRNMPHVRIPPEIVSALVCSLIVQ